MPRLASAITASVILIIAGCAIGVMFGAAQIEPQQILRTLFTSNADTTADIIVRQLRLPRIAAALIAGAALATSGALLQSATRNPLGDPHIFGLGGGAVIIQALAVAGIIMIGTWGITLLSVIASTIIAALIYIFASTENLTPAKLALIGVALGALTLAIAAGILAYAQVFTQQSLALLSGSVANRGWSDVIPVIPCFIFGIILAIPAAGRLNILSLGDRLASQLGANPSNTRLLAIISAGVLAGSAVALTGVVGLTGLLAPHAARMVIGNDARKILILSIPIGAAILLYADQIARLAFMPSEIPAGLVTTVVGAPLIIWVARKVL